MRTELLVLNCFNCCHFIAAEAIQGRFESQGPTHIRCLSLALSHTHTHIVGVGTSPYFFGSACLASWQSAFTPFEKATGKKIQNEIPLLIIFIPKWPMPSKHTHNRHTNTIRQAHIHSLGIKIPTGLTHTN